VKKIRILGIDPGSRWTGFGVVDAEGRHLRAIDHGTLKLARTSGKQTVALEERLLSLHHELSKVIETHRPRVLAIERVFFSKNAVSALKLGQARGAAILTSAIHGLEVFEYSPSEIKSTLVGHGHADKDQLSRVVEMLLGAQKFESSDASDALAIAICHALMRNRPQSDLGTSFQPKRRKSVSLAEAIGLKIVGGAKK
jgi:crossover junction endodeoxyribonuclease RuvC